MTKMKIKRPSERKRGGGVANTSPRSAQTRGKQREFDWRILFRVTFGLVFRIFMIMQVKSLLKISIFITIV